MFAVTLAALLLLPQQPVKVSALLTNDRPVVGERTLLRVTIETRDAEPERIEMPALPAGFDLVGTEEVSESRMSFPGGRNRVLEKRLVLVGRVPGQFTIPGVRVSVGGRTYTTAPLPIVVLGGAESRNSGPEDALLEAVVRPERVYVGQQIILEATASLTRGLRARQTRPATYQAPSPAGFWIHDVPEPLSVGMRMVDGTMYETQTFRRAYFPLSHGTFRLPPARLSYEVRRGFLSTPESFELVSDSPRVEVLPIPLEGRPDSYRGAVGRYTVRASLTPERVAVGGAARLLVEIEGTGNVKALPAPPMPPVEGLEIQPPTEDAAVDTRDAIVGGRKTFSWVLVAEAPGRIEVPAIEYAYFDPEAEAFATARTAPLALEVSGVVTPAPALPGLAPIVRSPAWLSPALLRSPAFLAAQLVPLLAIALAFGVRRRASRPRRPRDGTVERPDRFAALRGPGAAVAASFWVDLDASVRAAVADALEAPELSSASSASIAAALSAAGVAAPTAAAITDALTTIERVRFGAGSVSDATRTALVERAEQATRAIAKRTRAGHASALLALALAAAAAASPAIAQELRGSAFDRAVEAYDASDWARAAAAFEEHLSAYPDDANAWFDAGNAFWSAGDRGRAVHAWLSAVRRAPQHAGARANLGLTVGAAAQPFMPPRTALSPVQALAALAGLWWLGGALVAWRIARRGPLRSAVLVPACLAGLLAVAAWLGRRGSDGAVLIEDTTLLAAPVLKAEAIQRAPAGTLVRTVERRDGWSRVRVGPVEGWAEADRLADL